MSIGDFMRSGATYTEGGNQVGQERRTSSISPKEGDHRDLMLEGTRNPVTTISLGHSREAVRWQANSGDLREIFEREHRMASPLISGKGDPPYYSSSLNINKRDI